MNYEGRKPRPIGGLIIGVFFFVVVWVWERLAGANLSDADRLYLYFFQFMGGLSLLFAAGDGLAIYRRRRAREEAMKPSGVHGTAAFATLRQCQEAGLLDPGGLYIGVLEGKPLFYNGKAHLLTVAPARTGKGIGFVIPNLLHWQGSVFVTDPKGELACVTMRHRRERLGQEIFVLNPWGLHGLPQHRFNPLQSLIDAAQDKRLWRNLADESQAIALLLLPEPEDARNRYFREAAREILRALLLYLSTRGDPETCTLPELWRTVSNPARLAEAIAAMEHSDALDGALADMAGSIAHQMTASPEQFADFRQGAVNAVGLFNPIGLACARRIRVRFRSSLSEGRPDERLSRHSHRSG